MQGNRAFREPARRRVRCSGSLLFRAFRDVAEPAAMLAANSNVAGEGAEAFVDEVVPVDCHRNIPQSCHHRFHLLPAGEWARFRGAVRTLEKSSSSVFLSSSNCERSASVMFPPF